MIAAVDGAADHAIAIELRHVHGHARNVCGIRKNRRSPIAEADFYPAVDVASDIHGIDNPALKQARLSGDGHVALHLAPGASYMVEDGSPARPVKRSGVIAGCPSRCRRLAVG